MNKPALFNFRLTPAKDVPTWGADRPALSWYRLTLGYFWIAVGGQELLRYSQPIVDHWANASFEDAPSSPYDEYQIARYWQDLMELLRAALDPVPPDLAARVANADEWRAWRENALAWREQSESDEHWDVYVSALEWWSRRTWDMGHLNHPPKLWVWTVNDRTHLRWDTDDAQIDGLPLWEATKGEIVMTAADSLAEVQSFDARLIAAMSERVTEVKSQWPWPEVDIDLDIFRLENEQREWESLFENAVSHPLRYFEWEEVRASIAAIDAHVLQ